MRDTPQPIDGYDEPARYEIRIKGHLDDRWADRFDGLSLTREDNGDTLLTGPVIDQAALHGVLRAVRDLGVPLLSVTHQPVHLRSIPSQTLRHASWHELPVPCT